MPTEPYARPPCQSSANLSENRYIVFSHPNIPVWDEPKTSLLYQVGSNDHNHKIGLLWVIERHDIIFRVDEVLNQKYNQICF
jgi:hypothetical protein